MVRTLTNKDIKEIGKLYYQRYDKRPSNDWFIDKLKIPIFLKENFNKF